MSEPKPKKLKISRKKNKSRRERLKQQLKLIEKRGPYTLIDERINEMCTDEDLNSILCDAVRQLSYVTINSVCRAKLKVHKLPGNIETAIHILPRIGNFDRVCFMYKVFECYNNVFNFSDSNGFTHLHAFVILGLVDVVNFLLKEKIDINVSLKVPKIDPRPECRVTPLFLALQHQKTDIVKLLLTSGADVDTRGLMNETPLNFICSGYGQTSRLFRYYKYEGVQMSELCDLELQLVYIRWLIHQGSQVNTQDMFGNTPLINLLGNMKRLDKQLDALQFLLKNGAKVDIVNARNENAMHELCRTGGLYGRSLKKDDEFLRDPIGVKLATVLIKNGIDLNAMNKEGHSPLLVAVNHLNFDLVQLLLENNAYCGNILFSSGPVFGPFKLYEPTWKVVHAVFNIIDVLNKHGFNFRLERIIEVMKYFDAWKNLNKINTDSDVQKNISSAYFQYKRLISATVKHDFLTALDHFFTKIIEDETDAFYKHSKDSHVYTLICIQLGIMRLGNRFRDDSFEILQRIEKTQAYVDWTKSYKNEFYSAMEDINKIMKSTENIALLEYSICEDYFFLCDNTKRHIAKFLIRDFFVQKGITWMKFRSKGVAMTDKCMSNILKNLSNEDIIFMLELKLPEINSKGMSKVLGPF